MKNKFHVGQHLKLKNLADFLNGLEVEVIEEVSDDEGSYVHVKLLESVRGVFKAGSLLDVHYYELEKLSNK